MNLNELKSNLEDISLAHKQIISFDIGTTYDIATSKSSETYPAVWLDTDMLIDYNNKSKKIITIALSILTLAKEDDINDQYDKTSDMEIIADELLQAIDKKFRNIGINNIVGLALRNYTDDDLVGVRIDLDVTVGRECEFEESFNTTF